MRITWRGFAGWRFAWLCPAVGVVLGYLVLFGCVVVFLVVGVVAVVVRLVWRYAAAAAAAVLHII